MIYSDFYINKQSGLSKISTNYSSFTTMHNSMRLPQSYLVSHDLRRRVPPRSMALNPAHSNAAAAHILTPKSSRDTYQSATQRSSFLCHCQLKYRDQGRPMKCSLQRGLAVVVSRKHSTCCSRVCQSVRRNSRPISVDPFRI